MGRNKDLDISGTLRQPDQEFAVRSQGKSYPTEGLSREEANLLESQINDLMAAQDSSLVTEFLIQRQDAIALAATFAKSQFDNKFFGGVNAGDNEIGFSMLRPGHIRADPADGSTQNDWYFNPGTAGWNDWIGDGTQANNFTVSDDQVVVVLGLYDQDVSTEISGFNVDQFGRNVDMLPHDLQGFKTADNENEEYLAPLPTLVGQENDQIHLRLRHDRAVESQPRLLGFTFGLGTYLNQEDF